jgi:flagellar basal body-associated protein FliL
MIKIILLLVLVVIITGGLVYYIVSLSKLLKMFKDFIGVTVNALKDKKVSAVEKEQILAKWAELDKEAISIKQKFVGDLKKLYGKVTGLFK